MSLRFARASFVPLAVLVAFVLGFGAGAFWSAARDAEFHDLPAIAIGGADGWTLAGARELPGAGAKADSASLHVQPEHLLARPTGVVILRGEETRYFVLDAPTRGFRLTDRSAPDARWVVAISQPQGWHLDFRTPCELWLNGELVGRGASTFLEPHDMLDARERGEDATCDRSTTLAAEAGWSIIRRG